jgi:CxxC motif-containing protein
MSMSLMTKLMLMNLLCQCKSLQQGLSCCRCAPDLNHIIAISGPTVGAIQALENAQLQVASLKSEKKLPKEEVTALTTEVTVLHGTSKKGHKRAANPTLLYHFDQFDTPL